MNKLVTLTAHQPNFIPWFPFFGKMQESDIHVSLNWVQFTKNNFQNRFFLNNMWHTMSVNKGLEPIINKEYLSYSKDWNRIKMNLKEHLIILQELDKFFTSELYLTNNLIINFFKQHLNITTEIVFDEPTSTNATSRLVDLCLKYGAGRYLSGPSGKKYLNLEEFKRKSIEVDFYSPKHSDMIHVLDKIRM